MSIKVTLINDIRCMYSDDTWIAIDCDFMNRLYSKSLSNFYGKVLMTGLGFSIAPNYVANLPFVESVTVIEIRQDVIDYNVINNQKINIIKADAWKWYKNIQDKFDCAFHDLEMNLTQECLARELDIINKYSNIVLDKHIGCLSSHEGV